MLRFHNFYDYYMWIFFIGLMSVIYFYKIHQMRLLVHALYSDRLIKFYFTNLSILKYGLLKNVLFWFGTIFVILALFRPQYGAQKLQMNAEGLEVVFVIDVSKSMAAEDIKPQRLKLAQIQLKKLTEILDGHRMGLVAFAGQVGVISPLTQDVGALNLFIDSLDFDIFTEQGTNIAFALQEAKDLLTRGRSEGEKSRTKVIVLITDGEDHSGEVEKAVSDLKSQDIRTFVIGVGTNDGGKIPVRDQFGQVINHLKDKSGQTILTKPNFKFLKELSSSGGGGFYKLDFGSVANQALVKDFENLKKSKFESQSFEVKGEYFQYFLFIGLLFLIFSFYSSSNSNGQVIKPLLEIEDEKDE